MVKVERLDLNTWVIESPGGSLRLILRRTRDYNPKLGYLWWVKAESGGWVILQELEKMIDMTKQIARTPRKVSK